MTRDKLEIWKKMKELFLLYNLHLRESCAIVITPKRTQCWFKNTAAMATLQTERTGHICACPDISLSATALPPMGPTFKL